MSSVASEAGNGQLPPNVNASGLSAAPTSVEKHRTNPTLACSITTTAGGPRGGVARRDVGEEVCAVAVKTGDGLPITLNGLAGMTPVYSRSALVTGLLLAVACWPVNLPSQEPADDTQAEETKAEEPAGDEAEPVEEPPPVSQVGFESDELDDRWSATDAEAVLALTQEKAHVANGRGALEFAYSARQGAFEQITFTGLGAEAANALALKVKATSPTSISLGVEEQNGAMYQALLWMGPGEWVEVNAWLDELILAENSADENGTLDADQVRGFFLADLVNLPGEAGRALGLKSSDERLWLDDLELVRQGKTKRRSRVERLGDRWLLVVDGFEDDVLWGLPIREAGLKFVGGAPNAQGRQALEMTY